MIKKADYEFESNRVELQFIFSEFTLLRLKFKGIKYHINPFDSSPIVSPSPLNGFDNKGHKIVQGISYPLLKKLPLITFKKGYICYNSEQYKRYFIDCTTDYENYLNRFQSKTKSTLRRKIKKIETSCNNGFFFKIFKTPEDISEFLPIANSISKKSFQYQFLNLGLKTDEEYVNDYLEKAKNNQIVGFLLYAENKPVAYNLCPIYGDGIMIYYYTGYDPEFAHYSPGTVLQYKTIETAFHENHIKIYDLCVGEGEHKKFFTDLFIMCGDIYYFPITLRFLSIVSIKALYDLKIKLIKFFAKRILNLNQIKKYIRNKFKKNE